MQEYAGDLGIPLKGGRVVIQGFGNVGSHLARLLDSEAGAKVIAVSSVDGGGSNDKGLDIPGLLAHLAQGKPVPQWPGGKRISNEEVWTGPGDWLLAAAPGGGFTKEEEAQNRGRKVGA